MRTKKRILGFLGGLAFGLLVAVSVGSLAGTLNIPHTFSSGQVIHASDFNDNFTAVRTVVNSLDDQNIANGSITGSTKLVNGSVTLAKMANDSVDASKIVNGSIVNAEIADGTIAEAKLDINSAPTTNFNLYWNGSKLDYKADDTVTTTCTQILFARSTHDFAAGTDYASFVVNPTAAGSVEVAAPVLLNPLAATIGNLRVVTVTTPPATVVFTVRNTTGAADTTLTCQITSAQTTCSDTTNFPTIAALSGLTLKAVGAGAGTETYTAYFCMSPF